MENTLTVAKELYNMYLAKYGENMDQLKMHKLMYFADRESLMFTGELLFEEPFEGWKFGPVLMSVRRAYGDLDPFKDVEGVVSERTKSLLSKVLERYGGMSSWKLSKLSHEEFSWQYARKDLQPDENGSVQLLVDMMKVDAVRELAARGMLVGEP